MTVRFPACENAGEVLFTTKLFIPSLERKGKKKGVRRTRIRARSRRPTIGIVLSDDEGAVCRNDVGVERRKAVGDVGVELCTRLRPVVGVVIGASLAVAAGPEELPIG